MVAEGVKTARPLLELAAAHGVEMPIGEQVAAVLEGATLPGRRHPHPHVALGQAGIRRPASA